jgi:hypothetical protein
MLGAWSTLPFMNDWPVLQRGPLSPGPLRLAIFDTSALTSDVIAATARREPSSLVAGMAAGTVRGFIPHHVWAETPRVLHDRRSEGEVFDLAAAERLWWTAYLPLIRVVCTSGLPMTPAARVLAEQDPSDVGALQLAGVLAPVVLIAGDKDLRRSGLAHRDWAQVRAALGKVGPVEDQFRTAAQVTGLSVYGAIAGVSGISRLARANPWTAMLLAGATAAGVIKYQRRKPIQQRIADARPAWITALEQVGALIVALEQRHRHGEMVWEEAERGQADQGMLHQVTRLLACAPQPMTRTEILHELGPIPGYRHRDLMADLHRMLIRFPLFAEVSPGRWQVGRTGVDFGGLPAHTEHDPPDPLIAAYTRMRANGFDPSGHTPGG